MSILTKIICFSLLSILVGYQFYRHLSLQTKKPRIKYSDIPFRYWFSYFFTFILMFIIIFIGAKNGLFEKSSDNLIENTLIFVTTLFSLFIGFKLNKWLDQEHAI